jgi:hypothetical protein
MVLVIRAVGFVGGPPASLCKIVHLDGKQNSEKTFERYSEKTFERFSVVTTEETR